MILGFIFIAINIYVIARALSRRVGESEAREARLARDLEELERNGFGAPKNK